MVGATVSLAVEWRASARLAPILRPGVRRAAARSGLTTTSGSLDGPRTQSLTQEDVVRYVNEQFVRSRMLLVVVGGQRADVTSDVENTLAQLPMGYYEWRLPPPMPTRTSRWAIEHRALPTNYILGYFAGPAPGDRDYFTFQVATSLLSSQLNYELRSRRSLSYAVYAPFLDRAAPARGPVPQHVGSR